jgi:alkylated DNA repair dioxygenase AlkB
VDVPSGIVAEPVVERLQLDDDSWVDVARGLLVEPDAVYGRVVEATRWGGSRLFRYDRAIEEPRQGASWRAGDPVPHPTLLEVHRWIQQRYGVRFDGFALARYRDGFDGQAFHRDRDMRWLDDTIIAVLTLGGQRPWHLRPRAHRYDHDAHERGAKGATHDLAPTGGDLLVMGGACQARWEHSVPQVRTRPVPERVSIQWRWTAKTGRPVEGASYRAARTYGSRSGATGPDFRSR